MSNDPKYYEWLYSIDGTANPGHCLILNEVPVLTPLEAIVFVRKNFPEMTPAEHPIIKDDQRISDIAAHSQHEVEYLIKLLEEIRDDLKRQSEQYDIAAKKIEPRDVMSQVAKELQEQYGINKAYEASGVTQALMRLHSRLAELNTLAGRGRYSDWRIT